MSKHDEFHTAKLFNVGMIGIIDIYPAPLPASVTWNGILNHPQLRNDVMGMAFMGFRFHIIVWLSVRTFLGGNATFKKAFHHL